MLGLRRRAAHQEFSQAPPVRSALWPDFATQLRATPLCPLGTDGWWRQVRTTLHWCKCWEWPSLGGYAVRALPGSARSRAARPRPSFVRRAFPASAERIFRALQLPRRKGRRNSAKRRRPAPPWRQYLPRWADEQYRAKPARTAVIQEARRARD